MVTLEQVAEMALELPEATENVGGHQATRQWLVAGKMFVWERPLTKADIKRFGEAGEAPPEGDIVAFRVEDLDEKEAVLAEGRKGFFNMAHFAGYPAVLIELRIAGKRDVRSAILDAWLAMAPPKLAEEHLASRTKRRT